MSILDKIISPKEVKKKEGSTAVGKAGVKVAKKVVVAKRTKVASELKPKSVKQILIRPLLSEKSTFLKGFNQYVFAVNPQVNKIEIKREIKKNYKVEPIKVHVIRSVGKSIRYGKNIGQRKSWKKAIVTLKEGQTINLA